MRRLMRLVGLEAIYQAPRTSQPHSEHQIYPYLLRNMVINRPNQVWYGDITYIPVRNGFLYLVAVMDWATPRVLSWRSLKYEAVYLNELSDGFVAERIIGDWLDFYNNERTHQGKMCCGRTPFGTMMEGKEIWKEKFIN